MGATQNLPMGTEQSYVAQLADAIIGSGPGRPGVDRAGTHDRPA